MPTHIHRTARSALATATLSLAAAILVSAGPQISAPPPAVAKAAPGPSGAPYVHIGDIRRTGSESTADFALPPQGLYEGCAPGAPGDACIEHLAAIRAAGFRYVLDYSAWYGSLAEVLRYADAAAALGLQLIWPLNNSAWRGLGDLGTTYPSFAEGHIAIADREFASLAIGLVADHPATWGFYIGDELPAAEVPRVRALSATVRRLAPGSQQLYVARPGIGRLEPFAPFADVAGADAYPLGSGDPPIRQAAQSARVAATAAGARTAMVLQAFSWSQYAPGTRPPRYPSAHSLQATRDAAIHHAHPAMILWYSYQDILRSDHPQRRWRELARAAFSSPSRASLRYRNFHAWVPAAVQGTR